jgi:hypothetical protein
MSGMFGGTYDGAIFTNNTGDNYRKEPQAYVRFWSDRFNTVAEQGTRARSVTLRAKREADLRGRGELDKHRGAVPSPS